MYKVLYTMTIRKKLVTNNNDTTNTTTIPLNTCLSNVGFTIVFINIKLPLNVSAKYRMKPPSN